MLFSDIFSVIKAKEGKSWITEEKKGFQWESFDYIRTTQWLVKICLYQTGSLVVIIVGIKVTFSIIGLNNSSYTSIQS